MSRREGDEKKTGLLCLTFVLLFLKELKILLGEEKTPKVASSSFGHTLLNVLDLKRGGGDRRHL